MQPPPAPTKTTSDASVAWQRARGWRASLESTRESLAFSERKLADATLAHQAELSAYQAELSRVWSLARKWRSERGSPGAESDVADSESAELSRVWALARKWRQERDTARSSLPASV